MVISDTPHWHVDRPMGSSVVRMRRTPIPVEDLVAFEAGLDDLQKLIPVEDRKRMSLLVDLRDAPLRSDPKFEAVFERKQRQIFGAYRRIAVLVRTSVGKLQITRQARTMAKSGATGTASVFQDETAALDYLRAP